MFLSPALKGSVIALMKTSPTTSALAQSKPPQTIISSSATPSYTPKVNSRTHHTRRSRIAVSRPRCICKDQVVSFRERSGSDYVKKASPPEPIKRVNSTTKLTMKSSDYNSLSDQIARLSKSIIHPILKEQLKPPLKRQLSNCNSSVTSSGSINQS
jgi:hypothetical protein